MRVAGAATAVCVLLLGRAAALVLDDERPPPHAPEHAAASVKEDQRSTAPKATGSKKLLGMFKHIGGQHQHQDKVSRHRGKVDKTAQMQQQAQEQREWQAAQQAVHDQLMGALKKVTKSKDKMEAYGSFSTQGLAAVALRKMLDMTGECDLCGGPQQWLFVLATGRSGSTTVLEMLNAIPGFYLAGENGGVMNTLLDMYNTKRKMVEHGGIVEPDDGNSSALVKLGMLSGGEGDLKRRKGISKVPLVSEKHVLCALQQYVRTIIGSFDSKTTQVIGFKEIRHWSNDSLSFFQKVFPCARFIINTRRDLQTQYFSAFHAMSAFEKLVEHTQMIEDWQANNTQVATRLRLEDFSEGTFNQLMLWLGVSGCFFGEVLHANRGLDWNSERSKASEIILGQCSREPWKTNRTK